MLLDKLLLISNFQQSKICQDQRFKIRVNNSKFRVNKYWVRAGPFLPRESGEIYKMADGSDREVTQADQNDINSQWTVYFLQI